MRMLPLLLSPCLLLCGCTKEASTQPGAPAPAAKPMATTNEHGDERPLGALTLGAYTFELIQSGDITPGEEGAIDLRFAEGSTLPGTARAWVGVESADGSRKARLGKEDARTLHGHVEVPKPLPADSRIWIEIEADGQTQRGSAAWK